MDLGLLAIVDPYPLVGVGPEQPVLVLDGARSGGQGPAELRGAGNIGRAGGVPWTYGDRIANR